MGVQPGGRSISRIFCSSASGEKGLGRKAIPSLEEPLTQDRVIHIARYEEYFHLWIPFVKLLGELASSQMRHHNVCQQKIKMAIMPAAARNRIFTIGRLYHPISAQAEHFLNHSSHGGIVFNDQNRLGNRVRRLGMISSLTKVRPLHRWSEKTRET